MYLCWCVCVCLCLKHSCRKWNASKRYLNKSTKPPASTVNRRMLSIRHTLNAKIFLFVALSCLCFFFWFCCSTQTELVTGHFCFYEQKKPIKRCVDAMNNESLVAKHIEITHMELLIKQNFVLTISTLLMLLRKIVPISAHTPSRHACDAMRQASVKSQMACHMWYCCWNIDYIKIQGISRKATIQTGFIEAHRGALWSITLARCTFRTTVQIKYGFPQIN